MKVREEGLTVPSEVSLLLTVTVIVLEGALFRATLNVEVVPSSDVFPEILVMLKNALLLPEILALPLTQSASHILIIVAVFELPLLSVKLVPEPSSIFQ